MDLNQALDMLREEKDKCVKLSSFEPDPLKRGEDERKATLYQSIIDFVEQHRIATP